MILNDFQNGILPQIKQTLQKVRPSILACTARASDRKLLKILTPSHMLQRSQMALA